MVRRDADHRYWTDDGRELPSVTSVLHRGGLVDETVAQYFTEASRARGTDIHAALEAWAKEGVQPYLSPDAAPYWPPLMAFFRESGFTIDSAEQIVADLAYGYSGTYDLLGLLPQFDRNIRERDLIDVKTGALPRTVRAQTAAYARPLRVWHGTIRRWALLLTPDNYRLIPLNMVPGSFRVDRHADSRDEALFIAALTVANYRRQPALIGAA
jgi:hypothetical protein